MRWHAVLAAFLVITVAASPGAVVRAAEGMDSDGDGIWDEAEVLLGTDPRSDDTDGDGYSDQEELRLDYSPTSTSRTRVRFDKAVIVSLSRQELRQRVGGITVGVFPVSTGVKGMPTPTGTYRITHKHPRAWSASAKLWMPYWMQFTTVKGKGVGLHELPEWPNGKKEGVEALGTPASHGCVRLGEAAAKRIYEWAPIGTTVTVVR